MNTKLLRQKILDLAIRGKLTEQKKSDGTTKDLLAQIQDERRETKDERDAGKKDSSNVILERTSNVILERTSNVILERTSNVILERTSNVIASEAKQSKKSKPAEPKTIIPLNKDEAPFEIPETWEWVRLGDVVINRDAERKPVSKKDRNLHSLKIYDYYGAAGVIDKVEEFLFDEPLLLIGEDGANLLSRSKPNALIAEGQYWVNNHAHVIDAFDKSMLFYIALYINAISLDDFVTGTAQPKLNQENLNKIPVPLPPLAEQQRIVAAIESAFAEITAIENNQELLKKHIKQGRQKILDLAIRGKLTEQKESDGTTKDLLASIATASACHAELVSASPSSSAKKNSKATERSIILSKRSASKNLAKEIIPLDKNEAPFEIPETWEWVKLGDVCQTIKRGKSPKYTESNSKTLVFAQKCNQKNGPVSLEKALFLDESTLSKYPQNEFMQYGDTVINSTGTGTLGRVGYFNVELPKGISGIVPDSHVTTVRPIECNTQFIYYVVKCNQEYLEEQGEGSTNQKELKPHTIFDLPVALPPLAEQQRIVAAIEQAFAEFDAMEKL